MPQIFCMKKYTLVIMAAGMGSRYGGLKQLDPMSEEGDTLIDFSLRDAIDAGFNKIVFVIRKSFEKEFVALYEDKLKNESVELHYAYQEINAIPDGYVVDEKREKPWGTGHALLVAKDFVQENFIVINADDFYGKEAFKTVISHLDTMNSKKYEMCMVGYQLKNTVTENGYVSRGECFVNKHQELTSVIERLHIEKNEDAIFRKDEEGNTIKMYGDTMVSMNFWGFTPTFFKVLEYHFKDFLKDHSKELKSEYFIPSVVNFLLKNKKGNVKLLISNAKWMGVTYAEDREKVYHQITKMKKAGAYPKYLFKK